MDDLKLVLSALAVAAGLLAFRWPIAGLMLYLCFDFLRPHDYFVELRSARPMLAIGLGLVAAALRQLRRDEIPGVLYAVLPIGLLWMLVLPGSLLAADADLAALVAPIKLGVVSLLIMQLLPSRKAFDGALLVIAGSLTVLALDAVWEAYRAGLLVEFDLARVVEGPGAGGDGVFRDNNDLARALLCGVAIWSAFALPALSPWSSPAAYAGIILIAQGIVLTGSRGGLVTLIVTGAFLLFSRLKPIAALGIGIVALGLIVLAIPHSYMERFSEVTRPSASSSVQSRVDIWFQGLAKAVERPVFGHGLGSFAVPHHEGPEHPPRTAHNIYLELFYESGLLGLAGYLALLCYVVRRLWLLARRVPDDEWVVARTVALQAATFSFLVAGLVLGAAFQSIPFVMVGLAFALERIVPRRA